MDLGAECLGAAALAVAAEDEPAAAIEALLIAGEIDAVYLVEFYPFQAS
jgi:hypothetical protein